MVLNKKIKGNTLPEVLIALCLTSFSCTLAMTIYLNIQQSTKPFLRLKSHELAEKYLKDTFSNQNYFDATVKEGPFIVRREVTRMSNYPDCVEIRIVVKDQEDKTTSVLKSIAYVSH